MKKNRYKKIKIPRHICEAVPRNDTETQRHAFLYCYICGRAMKKETEQMRERAQEYLRVQKEGAVGSFTSYRASSPFL